MDERLVILKSNLIDKDLLEITRWFLLHRRKG